MKRASLGAKTLATLTAGIARKAVVGQVSLGECAARSQVWSARYRQPRLPGDGPSKPEHTAACAHDPGGQNLTCVNGFLGWICQAVEQPKIFRMRVSAAPRAVELFWSSWRLR